MIQTLGVKFSPDGRLLAARCADGTLRIWDARTPTAGLSAHREALALVYCLIARRMSLDELLAVIRRDVSISERVANGHWPWRSHSGEVV